MSDDCRTLRDVEAAQLILNHRRMFEVVPVPQCGITPAQLRAAVQFSESQGKIALLVCEDCHPEEKYLVVRLIDLPLLVSLVYEVLTCSASPS